MVSIIVPARNEEHNIGPCLASLLEAAAGVDSEVLVANDESTDDTAGVVRAIPQVGLLNVPPLVNGWSGKNHALACAVPLTTGEWMLFTDADTRHSAGSLGEVLRRAEDFDLYSLSPLQEARTWWERAVIPRVFAELDRLFRYDEINRPGSDAAAANGQYLLIRRSVYEDLGGHAAVAGEVLEDLALARAAKRSGFRIWFGPGEGIVSTRMYADFWAMWDGWTRNLYTLYGCNRRNMALAAFRSAMDLPGGLILSLLLINSLVRHSLGMKVSWKGRKYATGDRVDHGRADG